MPGTAGRGITMRMPKGPCLGCPDRSAECHRECAKYADYIRRAEIWRKYIQQQKLPEIYKRELTNDFSRTRRKR